MLTYAAYTGSDNADETNTEVAQCWATSTIGTDGERPDSMPRKEVAGKGVETVRPPGKAQL